jgi:hypothetical protein
MVELNHPCARPVSDCGFKDALKNCCPCLTSKTLKVSLVLSICHGKTAGCHRHH